MTVGDNTFSQLGDGTSANKNQLVSIDATGNYDKNVFYRNYDNINVTHINSDTICAKSIKTLTNDLDTIGDDILANEANISTNTTNISTNTTKLSGISTNSNSSNFNVSAQINANNTGYIYASEVLKVI